MVPRSPRRYADRDARLPPRCAAHADRWGLLGGRRLTRLRDRPRPGDATPECPCPRLLEPLPRSPGFHRAFAALPRTAARPQRGCPQRDTAREPAGSGGVRDRPPAAAALLVRCLAAA